MDNTKTPRLPRLTDLQMDAAKKILALRALSASGMITTRAQSNILRALQDDDLVAVAEYLNRTDSSESHD